MTGTRLPSTDEHWMIRAAALARRAEGQTSPNPLVGAILSKNGVVVGKGFHARAGEPHAEVMALNDAGPQARGSDLYVTLEPCAHSGRTPPCADAIIAAGVRRVVAGVRDPNPLVNGRGFAALSAAGIEVHTGVLQGVCERLIEPYARATVMGRPYVHLKLALSADGRIAPADGSPRWITGRPARRYAHRLRCRLDAILVGVRTVLGDDPALDVRLRRSNLAHPRPVVLDAAARTPPSARLMGGVSRGTVPLILCGRAAPEERVARLQEAGARVMPVEVDCPGRLCIRAVLETLTKEGVQSVLVEGGGRVAASFLAAGLVDRATLLLAPVFLGSRAVPSVEGLESISLCTAPRGRVTSVRRIGEDVAVEIHMGAD